MKAVSRPRLSFHLDREEVVIGWQGREIRYQRMGAAPLYIGLHYELAALDDGKLPRDHPRAAELQRFLASDFDEAVRDPDEWIRERLAPGIDAWTLRNEGESRQDQERRMVRYFLTGRK